MIDTNSYISSEAKGYLVAIGGAEDKVSELKILRKVLALAPEDNREVAVLATASGIPDEVYPMYEEAFEKVGVAKMHRVDVRTREDSRDPAIIDLVERCGTIFFTGGDQMRLTAVLGATPLLETIRARYIAGAVVAGTSAGAAAMSATMIYDGYASDSLRKGAVKMSAGLGFVSGVVIDSHFLERGRFTRLMEVGATNPQYLGVGIGEDTAAIFHSSGVAEILGSGHVIIVDSSHVSHTNIAEIYDGEPVTVENIVMHALIDGDGFDLPNRKYLSSEDVIHKIGKHLEDTPA